MSNGATHRATAFAAVALWTANEEQKTGRQTAAPLVNGTVAAVLTGLPDKVEPALHPNHRQFFHSIAFAAIVGYGVYKAYKWEPKDQSGHFLRWLAMLAGGAYLVHLAMDACTPKGLPLLGKL
jgi:inner membrane protein